MTAAAPSILCVDDDETNRQALTWLLRREGFRVDEAATGGEALRLMNGRPDLVILDVNLPDVSGFEVCRRIKAHPATARTPVLHLSAVFVGPEDKVHGLDGGADGYLLKPADPREVVAQARALLRAHFAEEQARIAARDWHATFDALRDAVCLLDDAGRVRRGNRALAELLGAAPEEILGRPFLALLQGAFGVADFPTPDPAGPRRVSRELLLGGRWLQVTLDPVPGDDGRPEGCVCTLADITGRRRLEEQLCQSKKLEAVGLLAGGVAHDFNNLLTAITGNVALLLDQLPAADPAREALLTINKAAWRAADLTRQLRGYSRQTVLWLQPVDCNAAVRETVELLYPLFDKRIQVRIHADPALWPVQADAGQLGQVLMNLCVNARDAMPEGGTLTLETANVILGEEDSAAHVDARPGEFVRLRVTDSGHGISPEALPRIFDPFFTTKEPEKGVGLGLAVVIGIVQQHKGWVACTSELGRGARFDVYLPRSAEAVVAGDAPAGGAPGGRGRCTILLIENEPLVRELGRGILRRCGHEVLPAEDGAAAARLLQAKGHQLDLVILDLSLRQQACLDALGALHARRPEVPVLVVSSCPQDQIALDEVSGAAAFLSKPFRPDDLADTVRRLLDEARARCRAGEAVRV